MLIVCNLSGGGAAFFREAFVDALTEKYVWLKYDVSAQLYQFIYDYDGNQGSAVTIPLNRMNQMLFDELLKHFGINEIFVNHMLDMPPQLFDLLRNAPVPYSLFIHDYFYICLKVRLYDENKQAVCSGIVGDGECARCCGYGDLEARSLKNTRRALLKGATAVIVPSEFVRRKLENLFPEGLSLVVKPHYLPWLYGQTKQLPVVGGEILTISFVGALTKLKGWDVVKDLLFYIREQQLPLRIAVIGVSEEYERPYQSTDGRFVVSGKYEQKDVSRLLARYNTAVAGVMSIWEETYSYTTSEAVLSGYPVMSFNIGAQAERIKKYDCGWVMNDMKAVYSFLSYIVTPAGRREILNKAEHTERFYNGAD